METNYISQTQAQQQALQLINICGAYQKVKPFVKLIRTLLFFSPKARTVFDNLITLADGICPGE